MSINIKDRPSDTGHWVGHPLFSETYLTNNNECIVTGDSYYIDDNNSADVYVVECDVNFNDATSNIQKLVLVHNVSRSSFNSATDLETYQPDCYWVLIDNIDGMVTLYYENIKLFNSKPDKMNGRYRIQSYHNVITIYKDNLYFIGPISYVTPVNNGYGGFFTTCKNLLIDNFNVYGSISPSLITGNTHIIQNGINSPIVVTKNSTHYMFGVSENGKFTIITFGDNLNINDTYISDLSFNPSDITVASDGFYLTGTYIELPYQFPGIVKINFNLSINKAIYFTDFHDEIYTITSDDSYIYTAISNNILKLTKNLDYINGTTFNIDSTNSYDSYITDMSVYGDYIKLIGNYGTDSSSIDKAFFMELNSSDLSENGFIVYDSTSASTMIYFDSLEIYNNECYVSGGIINSYGLITNGIFKMSLIGELTSYKFFQPEDTRYNEYIINQILPTSDGIFSVGYVTYTYDNSPLFWKFIYTKLDLNLNLLYSKSSIESNNKQDEEFTNVLMSFDSKSIILKGSINDPEFGFQKIYLLKIYPNTEIYGSFTTYDNQLNISDFSLIDSSNNIDIFIDSTHNYIPYETLNSTSLILTTTPNLLYTSESMFNSSTSPKEVSNLSVDVVSSNSANIYWLFDIVDSEEGYYIERKTGNGIYERIGYSPINTQRFFDNNLSPLTSYTYRVCTYNINSTSLWIESIEITTPDSSGLVSASNLEAISVPFNGVQNIKLNWYDKSSSETGNYIERKKTLLGPWNVIADISENNYSYLDKNVDIATQYYYRVQTYDSTSTTEYSNINSTITENSFELIKYPYNLYDSRWTDGLYSYSPDNNFSYKTIQPGEIIDFSLLFNWFPVLLTVPNNAVITNIYSTASLYAERDNCIREYSNPKLTRFGGGIGTGNLKYDTYVTTDLYSYNHLGDLTSWGCNNLISNSDIRQNALGFSINFINEDLDPCILYIDGFSLTLSWYIPINY